jgi:hypothetical protein
VPRSSEWSLPFRFPTKILRESPPPPHACYIPCPSLLLALIILIISGEDYKLWNCSFCSFFQPPVTSSHLGAYIFLSTLFSNTFSPFQNGALWRIFRHKRDKVIGGWRRLRNEELHNLNSSPKCHHGLLSSFTTCEVHCEIQFVYLYCMNILHSVSTFRDKYLVYLCFYRDADIFSRILQNVDTNVKVQQGALKENDSCSSEEKLSA